MVEVVGKQAIESAVRYVAKKKGVSDKNLKKI